MMMTRGSVKVPSTLLHLLCLLAQGVAQVPSVGSRRLERVLQDKRRAELDTIFEINRPLIVNEDPRATFLTQADIMSQHTRNAVTDSNLKWPKSPDGMVYVPYEMYASYDPKQVVAIKEAMEELNNRTCVRFVPRNNDADYLAFYPVMGCYAMIGHHWGMQVVSLDQRCVQKGIIQHELLHVLGFWHEQARSNRDAYVTVQWNNIIPGYAHNFDKEQTNNLGTPYDYGSLMHYSRFAFSQNRKPTLVPTLETNATLGQRMGLSDEDVFKVNRLYECSDAYPRGVFQKANTDKSVTEVMSNSSKPNHKTTVGDDNVASAASSAPDSPSSSARNADALPVNEVTSGYISRPSSPHREAVSQVSLETTTTPSSTAATPSKSAGTGNAHSQRFTDLPASTGDGTGSAPVGDLTAGAVSPPSHATPSTSGDHDAASQNPAARATETPPRQRDVTTSEPDTKTLPSDGFRSTRESKTPEIPLTSQAVRSRTAAAAMWGDHQSLTTTTEGSTRPATLFQPRVAGSKARKLALRRGPPEEEAVIATDGVMCDFETDSLCPWVQSTVDDFDWTLAVGETPSWNTGPRGDHTLGRCGVRTGHYLYMEASYPREEGHRAVLTSPLLHGPTCVTWWFHMNGASMGSLSIRLELLGTADWPVLWSASGHHGNAWLYAELAVFVPPRQLFKLHVEGVLGNGFQGDAAVDDVLVTRGRCGAAREQQQRFSCDGESDLEQLAHEGDGNALH